MSPILKPVVKPVVGGVKGLVGGFLPGVIGRLPGITDPINFPFPVRIPKLPKPLFPVDPRLAAGGLAIGRTFASKFPLLAEKIASLRAQGIGMSFERLRGMLKRWGPQALITIGLLSAAELAELIWADQVIKKRRMNVGNVRALRRSLRRIESFHRLCMRADVMRRPSRSRARPTRPGVQVVRAG